MLLVQAHTKPFLIRLQYLPKLRGASVSWGAQRGLVEASTREGEGLHSLSLYSTSFWRGKAEDGADTTIFFEDALWGFPTAKGEEERPDAADPFTATGEDEERAYFFFTRLDILIFSLGPASFLRLGDFVLYFLTRLTCFSSLGRVPPLSFISWYRRSIGAPLLSDTATPSCLRWYRAWLERPRLDSKLVPQKSQLWTPTVRMWENT